MKDQDLDACDCPACARRVGLYVPTRGGLTPDQRERMRDQIINGQDIDEDEPE